MAGCRTLPPHRDSRPSGPSSTGLGAPWRCADYRRVRFMDCSLVRLGSAMPGQDTLNDLETRIKNRYLKIAEAPAEELPRD